MCFFFGAGSFARDTPLSLAVLGSLLATVAVVAALCSSERALLVAGCVGGGLLVAAVGGQATAESWLRASHTRR